MENNALQKAISIAGSQSELARRINGSPSRAYPQLVQVWTKSRIPAKWVISVEKATGVSRHELRPDIYPAPD
jgi:DNA-binding transcriptional regulator YdaS (Cro superfamily)